MSPRPLPQAAQDLRQTKAEMDCVKRDELREVSLKLLERIQARLIADPKNACPSVASSEASQGRIETAVVNSGGQNASAADL